MNLPSHASRERCKEQRDVWRRMVSHPEGLTLHLLAEEALWLLDECDLLEREADSVSRDAQHWQDKMGEKT